MINKKLQFEAAMSGKDRQKFDFYCGFIDKLFKQINEMSKWDEPFLKNNLGKVDHALIEIKQLDLFFEKFEDFMIYKGRFHSVSI